MVRGCLSICHGCVERTGTGLTTQDAQKRLLHCIFGVGWVAQDGVGHAVQGACVLAHQRRKSRFFRLSASQFVHRAVRNLHPTCVNCLAGAHRSTDAGGVKNARMPSRYRRAAQMENSRNHWLRESIVPICRPCYFAASFCAAMEPAAPSLSASLTLAQRARA